MRPWSTRAIACLDEALDPRFCVAQEAGVAIPWRDEPPSPRFQTRRGPPKAVDQMQLAGHVAPSTLTPVKKGGDAAVLYFMNDLQFRMRSSEPISFIIGQTRPLAMCSPILHYQEGNVRDQILRKYPVPCFVHLQGPATIDVHDLDRRTAPGNLRKLLISIVIDNLPLSNTETSANALDVFLE